MHKAWYYASTVIVGHFERLIMYTGVTGQKCAKPVSLKQATITWWNNEYLSGFVELTHIIFWPRKARTTSWVRKY